ncbi:MAG: ATP-binding protein, partial [Chloroflexia bacterium]
ELAEAFDSVDWQIDPMVAAHTSDISLLAGEVIYYATREAIRNSARYARPSNSNEALHLKIAVLWNEGLEILVEDDGVGIGRTIGEGRANAATNDAYVSNGNATNGHAPKTDAQSPKQGSGQGLALHSTMMAVVGGSLAVESAPGEYTRVVLSLPGSN